MRIRALTLWEPWATLVAIGAKRLETRPWRTRYRGPLAIHAAKRWQSDQRQMLQRAAYRFALTTAGIDVEAKSPFPLGKVLAVANLTSIISTERARVRLAEVEWGEQELQFGDYRDGRWGWYLEEVRRLKKPVPARGAQGLWWWDVPEQLVSSLRL